MNLLVKLAAIAVVSVLSIGSVSAASDTENRAACKKLYVGQVINMPDLGTVILGIGEQRASLRVVNATYQNEVGKLLELSCTTLLEHVGR